MTDALTALRTLAATARPGSPTRQAADAGVAEIERLRAEVARLAARDRDAAETIISCYEHAEWRSGDEDTLYEWACAALAEAPAREEEDDAR
jgi:hypothetical protein